MVSHTHTSEQDIQEVKLKKSRKFKGDSINILWEEKFFFKSQIEARLTFNGYDKCLSVTQTVFINHSLIGYNVFWTCMHQVVVKSQ